MNILGTTIHKTSQYKQFSENLTFLLLYSETTKILLSLTLRLSITDNHSPKQKKHKLQQVHNNLYKNMSNATHRVSLLELFL